MSLSKKRQSSGFRSWQLLSIPFLLFLLLPIAQLLFRIVPGEFIESIQSRVVLQAIGLSLKTTLITVVATIVFGTPVAYLLTHRNLRLARFADTLVDLPTVLPPAVAGLALLMIFGRMGWIGQILNLGGIQIPFTTTAVVLGPDVYRSTLLYSFHHYGIFIDWM